MVRNGLKQGKATSNKQQNGKRMDAKKILDFSALLKQLCSSSLACLVFSIISFQSIGQTNTLRIAVASSFTPVLEKVAPAFSDKHQVKLEFISASSGTLFQQIMYGAPFDLFLSADSKRPETLVNNQRVISNSLYTYAQGQLALFSKELKPLNQGLLENYAGKFAIANPKTAPYGTAAKEVISKLNLTDKLPLITGQNVAQTYQQLQSGSVSLGIVSLGQLALNSQSGWLIPQRYYAPILQKMVIPKQSRNVQLSREFQQYILSQEVQDQFSHWGFKPIANDRERS